MPPENLVTKVLLDTDTGANGLITIAQNTTFEIRAINVKLVTDTGVANRTIEIRIQDDANVAVFRFGDDNNITASLTRFVNFAPHLNKFESADIFNNGFPDRIILSEGWDISIIINAVEGGDVHTTKVLGFERIVGDHVSV